MYSVSFLLFQGLPLSVMGVTIYLAVLLREVHHVWSLKIRLYKHQEGFTFV